MTAERVLVNLGNGIVVMHTWSEWLALIRGVDLEAARQMSAPLELEPGEEDP
jgi:hypothetical protein